MSHEIGSNLKLNAEKLSYNSVQGHFHGVFGVEYSSDKKQLNWSMGTGCLINPKLPAFRYDKKRHTKKPVIGVGMLLGNHGNSLFISDMHAPYQHPQALDFLFELNEIYKFVKAYSVGDLSDHHSPSFHTSEPDALNAEDEYTETKIVLRDLQSIFPSLIITPGNHCLMPQRKAKEVGLPVSMLSDFNQIYGLKKTWKWHDPDYYFDSKGAIPTVMHMPLRDNGEWVGKMQSPLLY